MILESSSVGVDRSRAFGVVFNQHGETIQNRVLPKNPGPNHQDQRLGLEPEEGEGPKEGPYGFL